MKHRVSYSGLLRTKIKTPKGLTTVSACIEARNAVCLERNRKLPELCAHYGIDFDASLECFRLLAMSLAADHVPGFQVLKRKRHSKAKVEENFEIARAIWTLMDASPNPTLAKACESLARHDARFRGKRTAKALESAFKRFNAGPARARRGIQGRANGRERLFSAVKLADYLRQDADGYPVNWSPKPPAEWFDGSK